MINNQQPMIKSLVASVAREFAALLSVYQPRPPRGGTTLEIGVSRLDGMPFE